jgi:hypothetical protein
MNVGETSVQIKQATGRQADIAALRQLWKHPRADAATKKRIEAEARNIRAGETGEQSAAYEIEFQFKDSRNWVTIHDLRLEFNGRVAQIDHLLINRLMQIWVCESKHFAQGVGVDDRGEWVSFWNGRPTGIPSPVEQNKRHIKVLKDLLDSGAIELPSRLGFKIKPEFKGVVLISNGARVSRPKDPLKAAEYASDVIKCERLEQLLVKRFEKDSTISRMAATMVRPETIARLGQDLALMHRPAAFDWAAKFGLPSGADRGLEPEPITPRPKASSAPARPREADPDTVFLELMDHICVMCGERVTEGVLNFCRTHALRFGGRTYCMPCQAKI